jgi:hypothetical protein
VNAAAGLQGATEAVRGLPTRYSPEMVGTVVVNVDFCASS